MKSDRLKKFELELQDLEEWLRLNLVPKKDIESHKNEINMLKKKITEEKERLLSLKEEGENEEYTMPKRNPQARAAYQEPHTLPGVDMEDDRNLTESNLNLDTESYDTETTTVTDEEEGVDEPSLIDEEQDDPFSDKNRWKRGILENPDSDAW